MVDPHLQCNQVTMATKRLRREMCRHIDFRWMIIYRKSTVLHVDASRGCRTTSVASPTNLQPNSRIFQPGRTPPNRPLDISSYIIVPPV